MDEDIKRIFEQEVREKRVSARGARKKKGKRGLVGKMLMPADFAGREYRQARDLDSFNITDLITKLSQAPTLKQVLLSKMDEEYKTYRMATERTIDAVAEVVKLAIEPLATEVCRALDRLEELEATLAAHGLIGGKQRRVRANDARRSALGGGAEAPTAPSTRIRWGSSPEEIRSIVAEQIRRLMADGKNIDTKTIRAEVPSMLKWLYGKKAVFSGLEDAKRTALRPLSASETAYSDAAPVEPPAVAGPPAV
ncbi:MAG TPA: hypothetical protein VGL40_00735 [Bacillota bacterium]